MRRILALALVAGVVVLAGAAVAAWILDADDSPRRAAGERTGENAPRPAVEGRAAHAERLEREGVHGVLYFTDERCRLRALRLPDLEPAPAPAWTRCGFSLSAGDVVAPDGAVWHPQGPLWARARAGRIEAFAPPRSAQFELRGTLPAFRPDGALTFVDDRGIVVFRLDCPSPASAPRCRRTLLTHAEVEEQVGDGSRIREMTWLDNDSFAAIVGHERFENEIVAVFRGKRVVNDFLDRAHPRIWDLRASPGGSYFSVLTERFGPWIYDGRGRFVTAADVILGGPRDRRLKVAWSPDAAWVALATPASVFIVEIARLPTDAAIIRLPLTVRELAWL